MHPITSDQIRTFLVRQSIIVLALGYVVLNLFVAVLLGGLIWLTDQGHMSIVQWFEYALLTLFSAMPDTEFVFNPFQSIVRLLLTFLSVTFPAILLGTIIFKILIKPKVIVLRNKCSIFFHRSKEKIVIAVRFYSSTPLELVNVNIKIIKQLKIESQYGNKNPIVRNSVIHEQNFAIIRHHKPFTTHIELNDDDVDVDGKQLLSIQGEELEKTTKLNIIITGTIPTLGIDFAETHLYSLPNELQWGKYQTLNDTADHPPGTKSKDWSGWDNWEGIEEEFEQTLPNRLLSLRE